MVGFIVVNDAVVKTEGFFVVKADLLDLEFERLVQKVISMVKLLNDL